VPASSLVLVVSSPPSATGIDSLREIVPPVVKLVRSVIDCPPDDTVLLTVVVLAISPYLAFF
jgi:hypothetical protein